MSYSINHSNEVSWDTDGRKYLTLAEIIEAAKKQFPNIPFEDLNIMASGCDSDIIWLKQSGASVYRSKHPSNPTP